MQYSLFELQNNIEQEIRDNASSHTRLESVQATAIGVGLRIATLAVLAVFMLPLSF
ncbi:hypothetical protein [Salidesulfovibrio onnuriiensis]|uniref:hypothetical protein n=1 Tax=Salidesulfovibrio onnuriiensis TaxID=2583823 RepID=UPI0016500919|nr:hypothetical protein [Salidesulfovibrio onnuriiensis]